MQSFRLLLLVLLSAVVSAQTDPSRDALFAAIRSGSVSETDRLLKAGASPNIVDADGTPALMAATLFGDASLVKLLLERGADPNRAGVGGTTALMWAVPSV
ncbi:MAG TPA: ankyrin repeat domain-containing protein, partial [Vicinamibacterales bacterium]|nr:ankyrin repeat domain-containing protein [Vicinamibacterales bacterium]